MLAVHAMTAKTTRRMQAMQTQPAAAPTQPAADTGNQVPDSNAHPTVTASTSGRTVTYTINIFGANWTITWSVWIWGIVFMAVGAVLCFLTLQWWKLLRIPLGGLIGFFLAYAIMGNLIYPYVSNPAATGWSVLWYCLVAVMVVVGVLLFWKCPNLCIGVTSCWLLYMAGTLFVAILNACLTNGMYAWVALLIVIAFAVGGFFLGCAFPNATIMIGTAFAGAYTCVVGLGLMTGQYPVVQPPGREWISWMYIIGQLVLSVAGLMFQWCVSYKKNNARVNDDETERLDQQDAHVQAQVEIKL